MVRTSALYILGWIEAMVCVAMICPTVIAIGFGETDAFLVFLASMVVTGFFGGAMILGLRGTIESDRSRDVFYLPILVVIVLPALAALPIYFATDLSSPLDAWFEAVSALSTTGASVFATPENLPASVNLWRALLQWIGGFLALILFASILVPLGMGGLRLVGSPLPHGEGDTLVIRVQQVARLIWWPYTLLTLLCTALLMIVGIGPFDALCHALATLSSGGFSTYSNSIGGLNSLAAEAVLVPFMWISALSFGAIWLIVSGRYKSLLAIPELPWLFTFLGGAWLLAIVGLAVVDAPGPDGSVPTIMIRTLFHTTSVLTTTGFYSDIPVDWLPWAGTLMMVLLWIGGGSASTAGGMKLMRFTLLMKHSSRELQRLAHPHGVRSVRYGGYAVSDEVLAAVWTFFVFFVIAVGGTALVLGGMGLDFRDSVSLAVAAMSNAGPAIHLTGAETDFHMLDAGAKVILALTMILGRLEIFLVISLFNPSFWRR